MFIILKQARSEKIKKPRLFYLKNNMSQIACFNNEKFRFKFLIYQLIRGWQLTYFVHHNELNHQLFPPLYAD